MPDDLIGALDRIAAARPLVALFGDTCQDVYQHCKNGRTNPESAAVPLLTTECVEVHGGMVRAVEAACRALGAETNTFAPGTSDTKTRLWVGGHYFARVDRPGMPPPIEESNSLADHCCRAIADQRPAVLLISDYGKGACTPAGLKRIIRAADHAGAAVLVDPHSNRDWSRYVGASLIKCNRSEERHGRQSWCGPLVVTDGANGIQWSDGGGRSGYAVAPRVDAIDVAGAGDVVLAVLGCCAAVDVDMPTACRLANAVAAVKVARIGPLAVSPDQLRAALLRSTPATAAAHG